MDFPEIRGPISLTFHHHLGDIGRFLGRELIWLDFYVHGRGVAFYPQQTTVQLSLESRDRLKWKFSMMVGPKWAMKKTLVVRLYRGLYYPVI